MRSNRGTEEGTKEEISFVKTLNKKKNLSLWNILNLDSNNHYAIHVTSHQFGEISQCKVKPKADIFISKGYVDDDLLKEKDYCLDENDLIKYNLTPVDKTGISVKLKTSDNYQILKMTPNTFNKIFKSYELGAGASIYSLNKNDLKKNDSVIIGWNSNWKNFKKYFNNKLKLNMELIADLDLKNSKIIKKYSLSMINKYINENEKIQKFIFQGLGNFKEPYTVYYLYEQDKLKNYCNIPFNITTGSGRSRGNYTLVIKPKKH
ncbi:hypothetical protein [Methanobrevibacter sp. DSM 116169]|uniref:hypothetical protein n=1 Tax=Methanobrevibacter sp. DSM 116169 TaxID=3242727 RepID=UPI0038FCE486